MAFTSIYDGIIFIEGACAQAESVQPVAVDLSFKFGAQLKSLRDVKNGLVQQAKECGCNAVTNFTYGQKSKWLAIDDVAYWGKGVAAKLSPENYDEIAKKAAH